MSIPTDPSLYSYVPAPGGCDYLFAEGETPDKIIASVTGVLPGQLWTGTDPLPPNGTVLLEYVSSCTWTLNTGVFTYSFGVSDAGTVFTILVNGGNYAFTRTVLYITSWSMTNSYTTPYTRKYYSGSVRLLPTLPGGPDSMSEVMALLSEDPRWAEYFSPLTGPPGQTVHHFSGSPDRTNIRILRDD